MGQKEEFLLHYWARTGAYWANGPLVTMLKDALVQRYSLEKKIVFPRSLFLSSSIVLWIKLKFIAAVN